LTGGRFLIIILGLVILLAAVIVGVAGVLANGGQAHEVTHFAVLGYHVTGSTGTLFLYGIVVGALAMAGLSMLLAGARRSARRGREARRGQRDAARPDTVGPRGDDSAARGASDPDSRGHPLSRAVRPPAGVPAIAERKEIAR
jgi:uncharacterized membrane protein YciS (DUF1049 family)